MIAAFNRQDLFPTLIFQARLEQAATVNAAIARAIAEERASDTAGLSRSNQRARGGWHSRDTLHRDAEFASLSRAVRAMAGMVAEDLGYEPRARPDILGMWAIVNPPGAANRAHLHPGALWSGVYYVSVPEGSGDIEFTDPRTANLMRQPGYASRPEVCRPSVALRPEAGMVVLFPGWLYHEVHPNLSDADRVIVSFNLG